MTQLERLIQQQVAASVTTKLSATTDKIAEEMAQEILRDPVFRQEMHDLIREAFKTTVRQLRTPRRKSKRAP